MGRRIYTRADLESEDFQPRFAAWLRVTAGGTAFDFMQWINRNAQRYREAIGSERITDHDHFTAWLEEHAHEPA